MRKIILLLLVFSILFTSCYTYTRIPISNVMNTWDGKTENDVVLHFGAPSNTTSDGAGGKILVYTNTSSSTVYYPETQYTYASSNTYNTTYYIQFYVNSDHVVYSWRTNYPDQIGDKTLNSAGTAVTVILILGVTIGLIAALSSGN